MTIRFEYLIDWAAAPVNREALYAAQQQQAKLYNQERQVEAEKARNLQNKALMQVGPSPPDPSVFQVLGYLPDSRQILKWRKGYDRYEFLRTLAPVYYQRLWDMHLREDIRFDDLVDQFIETGEKP